MSTLIDVMTSQEACFALRAKLGNLAAWEDLLSDMRQGKREFMGCLIVPVGRKKVGRTHRPVYALSDVANFINAVRDKFPPTARPVGGGKLETFKVAFDPKGFPNWKHIKFRKSTPNVARGNLGHTIH